MKQTEWKPGVKFNSKHEACAGNAYWAAMVTNYIKANRHRIPKGEGRFEAHEAIRREAHVKFNLSLSRATKGAA